MANSTFMPKDAKQIATVYETTDYDSFKQVKGNRKVDLSHVKKLAKSMERKTLLTPVIVNKNGFLKDGQHRFQARKSLGLPIPFIIDDTNGVQLLTDVQAYNSASRNWSLVNFIESQCELNNEDYQRLYDLMQKYRHFTAITIITVLHNKGEVKSAPAGFKEGEFSFPQSEFRRVDRVLELATSFQSEFVYFYDRRFVTALMQLIKTKGYDHARLIRSVEKHGFDKESCVYDYFIKLVELYNKFRSNKLVFTFNQQ